MIKRLVKDEPLRLLEIQPLSVYESYLEGKITKRPLTRKGRRAHKCLELVHNDVYKSLTT